MSIAITCICTRILTLPDDAAGTTTTCPTCEKKLLVPSPQTETFGFKDDGADETSIEAKAAAKRAKNEKLRAAKQREEMDNDDDGELDDELARRLQKDAAMGERSRPPLPTVLIAGIGSVAIGVTWVAIWWFVFGRLTIFGALFTVSGLFELAYGISELRYWGRDYGDS